MAVNEYNKEAPIQPDLVTGGMVVIDSDHQMVHRKAMYTVTYYNLAVVNNGTASLGLTIPNGFEIHIKDMNIVADGFPWVFDAVIDATYTNSGTFLIPFNHYSSSTAPLSTMSVNVNPTSLPAEGDYAILFGGGTGVAATSSTGGFSPDAEYILHPGNHLLRATNKSGATNEYGIALTWYEIID